MNIEPLRSVHGLTRFHRRVSRKRYLKSKCIYEYERITLDIPRKYHETIKPLLNQDFEIKVVMERDAIVITLTPVKTLRHAENTPTKKAQ
ncbi:MAG: hypothetical protein QXZ70_03310 [Candidatus Bathyarchaeia archaeon]